MGSLPVLSSGMTLCRRRVPGRAGGRARDRDEPAFDDQLPDDPQPDAPSATRSASSGSRAVARTRERLATFAHAVSRTRPAIASSSHSGSS